MVSCFKPYPCCETHIFLTDHTLGGCSCPVHPVVRIRVRCLANGHFSHDLSRFGIDPATLRWQGPFSIHQATSYGCNDAQSVRCECQIHRYTKGLLFTSQGFPAVLHSLYPPPPPKKKKSFKSVSSIALWGRVYRYSPIKS